ncbi:TetR/AcrR family transcriptional regulator [Neisseria zalophi]|uniref:TetR/AcrR family transcriptional regulator n=1 Tax=Neisseria zalophi TaxID=640030 RepID=A0A5J6PWN7_9NEIS|nr:TetR/AcrR family transcriptional regulator [Neisseria zalophi]QEY26684.1 TetR/AcrR family transcriptional regulator [Neisseria zalophi]
MSIKQDILVSAYTDFYKYGFNACGVEFLAKQAGVTKRTLYAHFGNKEELIKSVLEYRDQQFIQKLEAFFLENKDLPVIHSYLMFISNWITEEDFHGCLFINASAEFHNELKSLEKQITDHKTKIRLILLEKMKQEGIENAEFLSNFLFLVGEGMIVSQQTGQSDISKIWNKISDYISLFETKA